jgi:hypothetical protein
MVDFNMSGPSSYISFLTLNAFSRINMTVGSAAKQGKGIREGTEKELGLRMRVIMFWLLFGLGSALLFFGVLLSQAPGEDRTFDTVVFSVTGLLLIASVLLGRISRGSVPWRIGSFPIVILSVELLLCLYGLVSILTYRRR